MPHRPRPAENTPALKLSDLLPIPAAISKPNAYQVFGLHSGEQDDSVVTAAMQQVYQGLKESKPTADAAVWNQAAKLAEAARKLLEDPRRRRALDESLGVKAGANVATIASQAPSPSSDAADHDDPLAGLLPAAKTLSTTASGSPTVDSATSGSSILGSPGAGAADANPATSVLGVPPGLAPQSAAPVLGTPPTGASSQSKDQISVQVNDQTVPAVQIGDNQSLGWTPPKAKRKKRRKNTGVFLLGLFVLVMLGAIIGLLQFLSSGGRVALTPSGVPVNDDIVVSDPAPATNDPRATPPNRDGIIGNVPSSGIAESLRKPSGRDASGEGSGVVGGEMVEGGNPMGQMPNETGMDPPPKTDPSPTTQNPPVTPNPPSPEPVPTPDSGPTPEMITANDTKIKSVEQLIRSANWSEMKTAADALLKLELTKEQSERAGTLFDIADLAVFYRGAIKRGLGTLKTGGTFEIVKDFPVIVVEVSPETLSIQFNRRTKTFSVDELPPRTAEKIASFALSSDQPDAIAGQALYRLIDPKTRKEYREDTFEMLASVDGELEKVDTAMLQQVVKELFAE